MMETPKGEFATVLSYQADRYTATVRTENGRTLTGIPRLRTSPGEIAALVPGTEVLLSFEYGRPLILGVMPPTGGLSDETKFSLTDTEGFGGQGLNKTELGSGGEFRGPAEPDDAMPGDWAQMGPEGNLISVLAGGVNVMRSSGLSQVRTHLLNDLVEIISRNYRHVTDMGEFTVQNNEGRINMRFRGGTDQRTEAGENDNNWTIKFDMGAEGDLLNWEFTTPQGQTLFRFRVDSDGQCEIFGINGVAIHSGALNGGVSSEVTTGSREVAIGGDQKLKIDGTQTQTIRGSSTTDVLQNHAVSAGNDVLQNALRDLGIGAGRNLTMTVQGDPDADSVIFDIESGNWLVDIAGPTSPNPKSGHTLRTFAGDVNTESLAGGNFNFTSLLGDFFSQTKKAVFSTNTLPDSVVLGGRALTSHLVKYEQLEQHLMLLYQLLDRHIHLETGTSVAGVFPVSGVSGPPVVPFSSVLNPLIMTFKSLTSGVSL